MITRKNLSDAVASIQQHNATTANALHQLMASGRLSAVAGAKLPSFIIDGETITVRRHQWIHQGEPVLVERLMLAFGAWRARQEHGDTTTGIQRDRGRRLARRAGLETVLDFQLARVEDQFVQLMVDSPTDGDIAARLTLLEDLRGEFPGDLMPWNPNQRDAFFKGVVDVDTARQLRPPAVRPCTAHASAVIHHAG